MKIVYNGKPRNKCENCNKKLYKSEYIIAPNGRYRLTRGVATEITDKEDYNYLIKLNCIDEV